MRKLKVSYVTSLSPKSCNNSHIWTSSHICAHAESFTHVQLCVTLWVVAHPGSSVHRIFQAIILEWVAIFYSRGSSWFRDWPASLPSPAVIGWYFTMPLWTSYWPRKISALDFWVCHFNLHLKLFLSGEFEKLSQKGQFFTCSILGVKKCCWMYFEVWSQDWDRRHFSSVFRRVCRGTLWGHEGSMQLHSMPSFLGGWEEQQKQWWPILLDTISYSLVWRHWVTLSIIWVSAVRTPMVTGSKYEVPKVTPVLPPCGLITLFGGICWRPRWHSIPSFYLMNLKPLLSHTKPILA